MAALQAPHVRLLQQHPGCIVVHKPPGVPFHAAADQAGLLQLVRAQQGSAHLPFEGPVWPIHRLDSVTSGALVLATSREAAGELVAAFRRRQVAKYYVAISSRKPSKKMGSVVGDMQKGRRGSWMLAKTTQDPAVTRFTSAAVPGRPGMRAFLVKPETGRTHQLRVALKSLGSPVLGDERYAQRDAAAAAERTYLHAAALRFWCQGEAVQVVCPPADGAEFSSPGFLQLFDAWLPAILEVERGSWFEDNRLLRSELPPAPAWQ